MVRPSVAIRVTIMRMFRMFVIDNMTLVVWLGAAQAGEACEAVTCERGVSWA